MPNSITLYELNNSLKQVLKEQFAEDVWITAEITEMLNNSSGHCYLQLADKKEADNSIVATARGTIWAFTYRMLKPYFETTTGRSLAKGMKVMLKVEVVFHEVYGYSLNIKDIDPTFTIGDLERKKREIIDQLQKDGIIDMNRELEFPVLPKNVAVISSPTAAGLGDFMNHLETNPYGYKFHIKLFPAVMQGDKTTDSVVAALDRIYEYETLFDVVVLIRGGGSQTDLGSFDSYDMAANIAQFPIPVIAGIGHERDETVADRVAHLRVKTPTAAAAFLIDTFRGQEEVLEGLKSDFAEGVKDLIGEQRSRQMLCLADFRQLVQAMLVSRDTRLKLLSQRIEHSGKQFMTSRITGLDNIRGRMNGKLALLFDRQKNILDSSVRLFNQQSENIIRAHKYRLELSETKIKYVDPKNVLERGYSITRLNGKAVKDSKALQAGDVLVTEVASGVISSKVI